MVAMPPEWWVDPHVGGCRILVIPFHPPGAPVEGSNGERLRALEKARAASAPEGCACCWVYLLCEKDREAALERNQLRSAESICCVGTHARNGGETTIEIDNISFPMNTPITSARASEHVVGFATYSIPNRHGTC